jgi:hypothetical protein
MKRILILVLTFGTFLVISSCDTNHSQSRGKNKKVPKVTISDNPSRDDLIRAVRNHVSGKTYSKTTYERRQISRTCSQVDVDLDIHAKRNPELARCPYVGATYWYSKNVPVQKKYNCRMPPPPGHNWYVQKISSNKWRVSNSGSKWDLIKISSKSVGVDVIYINVRGSRNAFRIYAHQDC